MKQSILALVFLVSTSVHAQENEDEWLVNTMAMVLIFLDAKKKREEQERLDACVALSSDGLRDVLSGDEYGPLPEDPNGLVSDLPAVLIAFADEVDIVAFISDSKYDGSVRMTRKIVENTGYDIPVYGKDDIPDKVAEIVTPYCSLNKLIVTSGSDLRWLESSMRAHPDIDWADKIEVISIFGTNGDPGPKRDSFLYVGKTIGWDQMELIDEDTFRKLISPTLACDTACLTRAQEAYLDPYTSNVNDLDGRNVAHPADQYKEQQRWLNLGQHKSYPLDWRASDVIAVCRAAGWSMGKCTSAPWLIGKID